MKDPLDRIADFPDEFKNDIHEMFRLRKAGVLVYLMWLAFLLAQILIIMIANLI